MCSRLFEIFMFLTNWMNQIFHFLWIPDMVSVFSENKAIKLITLEICKFQIIFPTVWQNLSALWIFSVTFILAFPIMYFTRGVTFEKMLIFLFVKKFSDCIYSEIYNVRNTLLLDIFLGKVNSVPTLISCLFQYRLWYCPICSRSDSNVSEFHNYTVCF